MSPPNPFAHHDVVLGTIRGRKHASQTAEVDDFLSSSSARDTLRVEGTSRVVRWFSVILGIVFLTLLLRITYLQIMEGSDFRALAEGNRIRQETVKASRGGITDRTGTPLVMNVPNVSLAITTADLPTEEVELNRILEILASALDRNPDELRSLVQEASPFSYEPIVLEQFLSYAVARELRTKAASLPGVRILTSAAREYPFGDRFAHVLGYTAKVSESERGENPGSYLVDDYIGKIGIERSYEELLRGVDGKKQVEVDSIGKEKKVLAERDPESGATLTLSLDAKLQQHLTERLDAWVSTSRGTGGAAIALDPRNGAVLALASAPSFDPNAFVRGLDTDAFQSIFEDPRKPLFNRAITGQYPSGSTIKPVIAAAALSENVISPTDTISSTGGIRVSSWFFPDWKSGGHGATNLQKALAESVNTYFYVIGGGYENRSGLGVDRITSYARKFGMQSLTGIDLPGESEGFLPSKEWKETVKNEPWYIGDTYLLSIGQGDLLVTPLQMAQITATIANGGTVYRPQLLSATSTVDENGETITTALPPNVVTGQVVEPQVLSAVQNGLRAATISGSAASLSALPVSSAGKTGTAQFGDGSQTHSWFTTYAPYEAPEIVITVIIEGGGEGNAAALPVARETLHWYFQ